MRKILFSITLLLIAALTITACSAATQAAPTPTSGVSATGTVAATQAATSAATGAATGAATTSATTAATISPSGNGGTGSSTSAPTTAATSGATVAATTAATSAVTQTPAAAMVTPQASTTSAATGAATTAATAAATSAVTGTPQASTTQTSAPSAAITGTPFAGVSGQYVRLSILLQSNLITGSETGKITGVVINQPALSNNNGTATPAAGQSVNQANVPTVRYVLVNMSGTSSATGNKEILLPLQMFSFNPMTSSANGVSQTFTLKGSAATRASVPAVSLPAQTAVLSPGWDNQLSQYWASNGFAIPVTGASSQPGTDVLLRNSINGTQIVGNNNQALGQIADFLIDPVSGQFVYAVFNGGQAFGNRYFVVPVSTLIFQFSSASASGLGNVQLNFPSTLLNAAPSISSLNQIPFDPALLQQLNAFWQSLQNTNK